MKAINSIRHAVLCMAVCAGVQPVSGIDLKQCVIVCDAAGHAVEGKAAAMLSSDIEAVSGYRPEVVRSVPAGRPAVIVCTAGSGLAAGVDCAAIRGGWERYMIRSEKDRVYVIGSDSRGAAYGALHISERIGVSPWAWWADVPVAADILRKYNGTGRKLPYAENTVSREPSVKYRGLFINDEDWGMYPWASKNFEKELGDIGPKTYARVCELILRLKGNMLAPAMHTCSGAFYTHPESQVVADEYGIMITTSHCEPLLVNNASKAEWDTKADGEWNYVTNRDRILAKLDKRISDTRQYDNIYTMGLRGLHDAGMRGPGDPGERVRVLSGVIRDQREILSRHKGKPAAEIPQIFVPYKEALDIYDNGLEVPGDITLVWPDDNYGYLKRISGPEEQKRPGRSGIYYHLSYLGDPHDYLWLNTTAPAFMYEELQKAYRTGADRYWLINAGDIKPMELGLQTFFDMAYDIGSFSFGNVNRHQTDMLCSIFGERHRKTFQSVLDTYYRLAWDRKPEYMGYEREWARDRKLRELRDTDFSFLTGSAQRRLADYAGISDICEKLYAGLADALRPAFFEMIGFPVQAADQMNRKFLYAQLSHETGSDSAARASQAAFDSISALVRRYNTMLGGKWNHMMDVPKGLTARYHKMPPLGRMPSTSRDKNETPVRVVSLRSMSTGTPGGFRLIEGIGTDWLSLQLGDAFGAEQDAASLSSPHADFDLGSLGGRDSVTVRVKVVPLWPLYQGGSNRFGVSVDGGRPQVCENKFREYSDPWRDQVLVNSKMFVLTFPLDKSLRRHTLSLVTGDPGQIVQRVEVVE